MAVRIFPAVPEVTTLVVRMVIGLFPPAGGEASISQRFRCSGVCTGVIPAPPCSADIGKVLMMVVLGLEVAGETLRMVGLVGVIPASVVCFPSADVTSFRIVPAGRAPFAWGEGPGETRQVIPDRSDVIF